MPPPPSHGNIRADSHSVIGHKAFGGHFRSVRQRGDERSKAVAQFFGLLRVKFAPFDVSRAVSPTAVSWPVSAANGANREALSRIE